MTCERVWEVHRILEEEIFAYTQINMHHGKMQVWNRGVPRGVEALTRAAQQVTRGAIVWRGDARLPEAQQGEKILGIPVGQPGFVRAFFGTEVGGTRFAVRADSSREGSTISMVDLANFSQGVWDLSAFRVRSGAHWASLADCLRMVRQRHPSVADTTTRGLEDGAEH